MKNFDFIESFNEVQKECFAMAKSKGFWDGDNHNVPEKLALIHSEISEGLEHFRHNNSPDDKLPHYSGLTVELADAIIRIMDLAEYLQLPVADAICEKMEYNSKRPYKHGKNF